MKKKLIPTAGFTLVELMIVVSLIGLLTSIAVPSVVRGRKRSQAVSILNDLRMIDAAIDQQAMEKDRRPGSEITWDEIKTHLKPGTVLQASGKNVLGGDYATTTYTVDGAISTPAGTAASLSDVVPVEFWSPYNLQ